MKAGQGPSVGDVAAKMPQPASVPDDPSAEDLEAMLTELIIRYKDPAFQGELLALQSRCLRSGVNLLLAMGPVVLQVQAPVLEKYGQPPNAKGVDNMKHAVQRRVAEGAVRVEELANEARRLLRLDAMPDRARTAEQVLAGKLDETNKRFGIGTGELGAEEELVEKCRGRIAADRQSSAVSAASGAYLEQLLDEQDIYVPSVLAMLKMSKYGVSVAGLQGRDVPCEVPVLGALSPEDLFSSHVLLNRPAVLRGKWDDAHFPPLRDFCDVGFLRRCCGHRRVLVKSLGYEDQQGRPIFVSDPELKLPFAAFLDSLEEHARSGARVPFYLGKVPLRKELPELAQEIERAPTCPLRDFGTCFGSLVPEGVFTYFGCGRNTTALHYDANDNLLLCIRGTKRLLLYPPSDARYLYPCNDFTRSAVVPFAKFEDLSDELRRKFALVPQAHPIEVRLVAGDMLYLPSCWWHCVEGSDEPNMILNWWFSLHPDKMALAHAAA